MTFAPTSLIVLTTVLACALVAGPAQAVTHTVNTTVDQGDFNPGDAICDSDPETAGDQCTLRAAVEDAGGLDTVERSFVKVPSGTYDLSLGAIAIISNLELSGAGARDTIIRQKTLDRVFYTGGTVDFIGITISGGTADSPEFYGGNVFNDRGTVTITDSTISDGHAGSGGGVGNQEGTMTIRSSTLTGNAADIGGGDGGAILNIGISDVPGSVTVENSTISGNSAHLGGGIISRGTDANSVTIRNSTIASNTSGDRGGGGGLLVGSGSASVENTILAGNSSIGTPFTPNCSTDVGAAITSLGFNLESGSDCGFKSVGDIQDTDPGLGPLQDNGGPTDTRGLVAGSKAIDAGNIETCLPTDQRGLRRPQGPGCDIGAFELILPDTTIDSGPSGTTNDNTPTFGFSSDATGATFECRVYSGAPSGGFSSCSSPHTTATLADGAYTFEVRALDSGGNVDPSPAARSFTVDATPPNTTIDSGPTGATNDSTPTFGFSSEAGATFECRVYSGAPSGAFAPCTSLHTTATLADGSYTFEVRATDGVGNMDPTPAQRAFTVDTAAPNTTIDSGPTGATNDNTPTFGFSSSEPTGATFECRVYSGAPSGAFGSCSSPHTTAALGDGSYTFEVRALDSAGNVDPTPAQRAFTVDTAAPNTTIDSGPSGATSDSTPTFGFSSEAGATFECRVYSGAPSGAFGSCSSPHTTAALADGSYTFEVRARDAAGNVDPSPAARSFTVDATPPNTTIDSGPTGATNDSTPTFGFSSEAGATFECRVYSGAPSGAFASCSSPHTTAALGDGSYTFEVRALDSAGNVDPTPAQRAFTVDTTAPDTTAPDTTIDSGPSPITRDRTLSFSFSSAEPGTTFECSLDGSPFVPCSSPFVTGMLAPGRHEFRTRARDADGNVDPTPAIFIFAIPAELKDLDPPVIGKSVNAEPVSGSVFVAVVGGSGASRRGGARAAQKGLKFVPLREAKQIPVGSFFNTRKGRVRLQSATARKGKRQAGVFSGGLFQTLQSRKKSAGGVFDLRLKGSSFSNCTARGKGASLARRTTRRIRRLSGNARGRFRTRGRYSAATVRGTVWTVTDRCDGTVTKVSSGRVAVRDFRRRKNVLVGRGKSYLARAPG